MRRGTTPTFTFTADMDCSQLDKLDVSFAQRDEVVLSKGLADCVISGNYPTPGGVKMVNQAFINYIEQLYQF